MNSSDPHDFDSGPDPATIAASEPEPEPERAEANPVYVVGIGPGNHEYLTPRNERAIREADVVVGFETVVEYVREVIDSRAMEDDMADDKTTDGGEADGGPATNTELLTCGYADEGETLETFADSVDDGRSGVAVSMGDPNFSGYQFVGKVQRAVGFPVRVLPGISSLQIAASRARTPMEEASFVTLHKSGELTRDRRRLRENVGDRHLLVLPRPYDWMPGDTAADLLDAGAPGSLDSLVFERLTHDDERVTRTTLDDLATHAGGTGDEETPFSDLSVLVVRAE